MGIVPDIALEFGFAGGSECPHSSRTITVPDLRNLLAATPAAAGFDDYRQVAVEDNALLKNTYSSRQKSFRYLREFYGLSPQVLLFRALRDLWDADPAAQPLLAALCALARDPVMRATAETILAASPGTGITPEQLTQAVHTAFPERFNESIAGKIGRNAASSWQQSGHLAGFKTKTRAKAVSSPTTAAYALLLGYLCGARGDALFETFWCRVLDEPASTIRSQAQSAGQAGWLDYRHSGQVTEVTFSYLMRDEDSS